MPNPLVPDDSEEREEPLTPPTAPGLSAPSAPLTAPALLAPPELNREAWDRAARRLLAKMLGAFAYEGIIEPVAQRDGGTEDLRADDPEAPEAPAYFPGPSHVSHDTGIPRRPCTPYIQPLDDGTVLSFRARRGAYDDWLVDAESVSHGGQPFTDPLAFLVRARRTLGLDGATFGHLVGELTATLAADTRLDHTALPAARLAELGYAELEGHQTGHPWLVLNKGRVGFSAADAAQWAPEARRPARLPWIAVRTDLARYRGVGALATPDRLYTRELDPAVREGFAAALRARGLAPDDYLYLPVHPWQWDEVVLPLFAPAVAEGAIVPLPGDTDLRLPQQSIRTFLNTSRPDRHTVKLPLSILNTLVWRGLPTERTLAAPAVTAWVHAVRDADPFLRDECEVILLGEVASVAVEHPLYDHLAEVPYQYKELLGAIWREPLQTRLRAGERARTLAALLHTDPQGRAFTAELVARSGLAPRSGCAGCSALCCRRCCGSSTGTGRSSHRTARTPSSSSTTTTCPYAWRSRTSSTTSTSARNRSPSTTRCPRTYGTSC